jgi:hypothetical protein
MRLLRLGAVCLATAALIIALPMLAAAQTQTDGCGWEDGTSTILGFFGTNLVDVANVTSPGNPVHDGTHSLTMAESPHSGTPQAYIAYIEGLQNGDQVTASFWGYDDTPDVSPSLRIWGHWGTDGDVTSYVASASGPSGYSNGIGWEKIEFTWTLDTGAVPAATALIVECRLYSTPSTDPTGYTQYWIDDVEVTAPSTASITLPCATATPVSQTTWGAIKTLY